MSVPPTLFSGLIMLFIITILPCYTSGLKQHTFEAPFSLQSNQYQLLGNQATSTLKYLRTYTISNIYYRDKNLVNDFLKKQP